MLQEIEEEDAIWQIKSRESQKQPPGVSVSKGDAGESVSSGLKEHSRAENTGEQQRIQATSTRQPQSSRDYGA